LAVHQLGFGDDVRFPQFADDGAEAYRPQIEDSMATKRARRDAQNSAELSNRQLQFVDSSKQLQKEIEFIFKEHVPGRRQIPDRLFEVFRAGTIESGIKESVINNASEILCAVRGQSLEPFGCRLGQFFSTAHHAALHGITLWLEYILEDKLGNWSLVDNVIVPSFPGISEEIVWERAQSIAPSNDLLWKQHAQYSPDVLRLKLFDDEPEREMTPDTHAMMKKINDAGGDRSVAYEPNMDRGSEAARVRTAIGRAHRHHPETMLLYHHVTKKQ
jgi:hypothetical protein